MSDIVPIDNKGDFQTLLDLYNQMTADQDQLEADLEAGNKTAAEADVAKLQALVTDMDLDGHATHISTGPITEDTVFMEGQLYNIMGDINSGNFGAALTGDQGIVSALDDIKHRIL